jgi:uncharacterized protein YdeI (YjbR/CyaY-like superfamily)
MAPMSPLDASRAIPVSGDVDFDAWLRRHGDSEQEVFVAIFKKSSGKPTVTVSALQETALCHGWIDSLGTSVARFGSPRDAWGRTGRTRTAGVRADSWRRGG